MKKINQKTGNFIKRVNNDKALLHLDNSKEYQLVYDVYKVQKFKEKNEDIENDVLILDFKP